MRCYDASRMTESQQENPYVIYTGDVLKVGGLFEAIASGVIDAFRPFGYTRSSRPDNQICLATLFIVCCELPGTRCIVTE